MAENDETCFHVHKKLELSCDKSTCKYWIDHGESHNCVIIASGKGPKTLQEIGDIFNLTRMRVCQIEKSAIKKLRVLQDKRKDSISN